MLLFYLLKLSNLYAGFYAKSREVHFAVEVPLAIGITVF